MRFLPVFLDLQAGSVALVGASAAAVSKLQLLRSAGAKVRWYASDAGRSEEVLSFAQKEAIELDFSDPLTADFTSCIAVVAALDSAKAEALAKRAQAQNVPLNIVDRPDLSSFIFPAIVDRGDVVVAIGTGGASPVLARRLRERIEAILPARIGELSALMGRYRERFARARHVTQSLRLFWERVVDGPVGALALAGKTKEAEAALEREIVLAAKPQPKAGRVTLVGAGPGDPDLLTLRALHALQAADVIFYDDLVNPEILDRARRDAEKVFVGKRRGIPGIGQDEINRLMAEAAKQGHNVVRLKGGDPFIFGRGGEELEYLRAADVSTSVVPGITAALGCAAEAALPLTYRNEASRLSFVTAHRAEDAAGVDWRALADPQTTVAIYMGLQSAAAVRDGLIAAGRLAQTPAGVLARGTNPDSKVVVGTLKDLPALAAAAGEGPALLIVGDVVARSDAWREASAEHTEVAA